MATGAKSEPGAVTRNAFQGPPRLGVEEVERVGRQADEEAAGNGPRRQRADQGNAEQLENAGRPPRLEMGAPTALGAREGIVERAENAHRGDRAAEAPACEGPRPDRPAHQRQTLPTMVERERARAEQSMEQLAAAMCKARKPSRLGRAVVEVELDLLDAVARPAARRSSFAPRIRSRARAEARGSRTLADIALPRERFARRSRCAER